MSQRSLQTHLKKNCFVDSITAEINDKVSLKYIHFCHLRDFCNLSWCLLQIPSFVAPETTVKSPERSLKLHRFGATRQQGLENLALIYLCLKDSWSCAFLSSVVSYQHLWCTFFSFCVHWILPLSCPSSVHLCLFHCFLFMVWFVFINMKSLRTGDKWLSLLILKLRKNI